MEATICPYLPDVEAGDVHAGVAAHRLGADAPPDLLRV